jgi:hypothetical protein
MPELRVRIPCIHSPFSEVIMATTLNSLKGLAQMYWATKRQDFVRKCILTGEKQELPMRPAIVKIRRPNGQEFSISGPVSDSVIGGSEVGQGKVINIRRKSLKMVVVERHGHLVGDCEVLA